ncbi:hypothetical protein BC351_02815 [Paenibacillus ferrarius]|uniref:DUF3139 domain-containing protein n=1 Tax=Paenibacillus ferrarius TaxID=1469647 RepID=A0A1V4H709_9BACL|nr:DUF3139 domain-containing protein [Paenibacillus ferrarius]OPH46967.1 hypothetical protein BC351_13695 [Paenibacillus ferrarius]OPH47016.1 hypothetical protein BC351_40475 [Paenibacillus ferrarius]OPH47935.1 hypothetical protein BC351_39280 [Paenibacillus ferrarius]OPH62179.1 hypothetical protein BC351_02815 [Paenibacillus ferrarius]
MKWIAALLVIGVLITPFFYVQANKIIYANKVTNYLLNEQHYKKNEIKSVKGIWGIKLPSFYTVVVFENEPYVEYIYFAHNNVMQFSHSVTEEGKQLGITDSDLKNLAAR